MNLLKIRLFEILEYPISTHSSSVVNRFFYRKKSDNKFGSFFYRVIDKNNELTCVKVKSSHNKLAYTTFMYHQVLRIFSKLETKLVVLIISTTYKEAFDVDVMKFTGVSESKSGVLFSFDVNVTLIWLRFVVRSASTDKIFIDIITSINFSLIHDFYSIFLHLKLDVFFILLRIQMHIENAAFLEFFFVGYIFLIALISSVPPALLLDPILDNMKENGERKHCSSKLQMIINS